MHWLNFLAAFHFFASHHFASFRVSLFKHIHMNVNERKNSFICSVAKKIRRKCCWKIMNKFSRKTFMKGSQSDWNRKWKTSAVVRAENLHFVISTTTEIDVDCQAWSWESGWRQKEGKRCCCLWQEVFYGGGKWWKTFSWWQTFGNFKQKTLKQMYCNKTLKIIENSNKTLTFFKICRLWWKIYMNIER